MNCPKCNAPMEQATFETVTIDRCTQCHGLWFDEGELARLKKLPQSQSLDIGNPAVGHKHNAIEDITCPRCQVPMKKTADIEQHHIWFETCPTCKGSFFDAGEFKDLKTYNLFDYVRGLFTHERKS